MLRFVMLALLATLRLIIALFPVMALFVAVTALLAHPVLLVGTGIALILWVKRPRLVGARALARLR